MDVTKRLETHVENVFEERKVTYCLEIGGNLTLVKNVPARVNVDTGEEVFSAAVSKRLKEIVDSGRPPDYTIETQVYNFEQ